MAILVFRLLDRQRTDSKQIGDDNKALDFAEYYDIKNPFFVRKEGGVKVFYRYINGSKSLELEKQILDKEIYNPIEDVLGFSTGEDILVDDEFDKNKAEILKMHPWNVKSPYHVPGINKAVFVQYIAQEEAKAELDLLDDEDEAMEIVRALKNNPEKLRQMAYIFNVSTIFSPEEMYRDLRSKAKENPKEFVKSIGNLTNYVLSNVKKGFDYTVISWDAKGCIFTKEGGLIIERTEKTTKLNEGKLVEFFMSEEGKEAYKQLLILIEHAEIDAQNAKT